jgi:hypothetical protein
MSKLSNAQLDALLRLARAWAAGQPEPWDDIRPQTREALRRAGFADGGIGPAGLYALFVAGPAVGAWAAQLRRVAEADARRRSYLQAWWAEVPRAHPYGGAVPLVTSADLRAAAYGLAPLEVALDEARGQAWELEEAARAEVRAALRVEVDDA